MEIAVVDGFGRMEPVNLEFGEADDAPAFVGAWKK
jgi:hypothetical protein